MYLISRQCSYLLEKARGKMIKKCNLCGGRLSGGKCEFCGLDNSLYGRDYQQKPHETPPAGSAPAKGAAPHRQSSGAAHNRQTKSRQKSPTPRMTPARPSPNGRRIALVLIISIAVIFVSALLPVLIQAGKYIVQEFSDSGSDYSWQSDGDSSYYDDYDLYSHVKREIPTSGDSYETVLGDGFYLVGVHIPEGVYTVELQEGTGSFNITDEENIIYEYFWFGDDEDYDEILYLEDVRLYNGAWVSVSDVVFLTLSTDNAQPLTAQPGPDPLADGTVILDEGTYIAGDDFTEGVYDLYPATALEEARSSIDLTYPDGGTDYLWMSNSSYNEIPDYYLEHGVKNVVLSSGTELLLEGDDILLQPSEGYFEDYQSQSP